MGQAGYHRAATTIPSRSSTGHDVNPVPAQGPPTQAPLLMANRAPCQVQPIRSPPGVR
jgi:hypothetical protein